MNPKHLNKGRKKKEKYKNGRPRFVRICWMLYEYPGSLTDEEAKRVAKEQMAIKIAEIREAAKKQKKRTNRKGRRIRLNGNGRH